MASTITITAPTPGQMFTDGSVANGSYTNDSGMTPAVLYVLTFMPPPPPPTRPVVEGSTPLSGSAELVGDDQWQVTIDGLDEGIWELDVSLVEADDPTNVLATNNVLFSFSSS